MPLIPFEGRVPRIEQQHFIAPDAWVIGDVSLAAQVSIFFGAVVRGDIQPILIGEGTNLQEHVVVHTSTGLGPARIGSRVTVGHRAIIHGCTVEDNCIIGMGSTLLDGACIERNCIIGAQSLVPMGMRVPQGHLALGVPAKVVRPLTQAEISSLSDSAEHYVQLGAVYHAALNATKSA